MGMTDPDGTGDSSLLAQLYAVQHVRCPRCERRLLSILVQSVILWCRPPIEITARPDTGDPLLVCQGCGELVPVGRDILEVL